MAGVVQQLACQPDAVMVEASATVLQGMLKESLAESAVMVGAAVLGCVGKVFAVCPPAVAGLMATEPMVVMVVVHGMTLDMAMPFVAESAAQTVASA